MTTTISAHRISESTPSTASRVAAPSGADGGVDRFAQRVERAGADVAVDDADAAERERPEAVCGRASPLPSTGTALPMRSGECEHGVIWRCLVVLLHCNMRARAYITASARAWPLIRQLARSAAMQQ